VTSVSQLSLHHRIKQHPMATEAQLKGFIERQRILLKVERDAELARTALVLSSCGPKLLELKGLALLGLGVASMGIGLGGKKFVIFLYSI